MARNKILFVKLGSFSHTNEHLAEQLIKHFPQHELIVADVKELLRTNYLAIALNIAQEVAMFGISALRSRHDLYAFFFRTSFMFRRLSQMIRERYSSLAPELDFVIQTQGFFNAKILGRPLLIYTDYTMLNGLDEPDHDSKPFPSKTIIRYETELYRNADAIAVAGSHVERTLVNHYGCDPARVRTIYIGANVDPCPVSIDPARYAAGHILFVGVEWERKGGPAMFEAFTQLTPDFPNARLTVVGCSPAISHPQVTVIGQVPRDQMPKYFSAASIFCMPSLIEPLGIATVEASCFKLPVIGTGIGGFFETVTDGETGILVKPNDIPALAAAMKWLLADPALAARMGAAGYERNRLRFDWNEVGRRLYDQACSVTATLNSLAT